MGIATLTTLEEDLRYALGGSSTGEPTVARLDRWINYSYLWVSMPNHYRHMELETSETIAFVANTHAYALANTYYLIEGVTHVEATVVSSVARRTKLNPVDIRGQLTLEWQTRKPGGCGYSLRANQIWIDCVPDTASVGQLLEVYGYRQPPVLTGAATTLLRPEWDEVILKGAEWRGWTWLNETDRAYDARQEFGMMVNEIADVRRLHAEEWDWSNSMDYSEHMRTD